MKQKTSIAKSIRHKFRGIYNCGGYALNTFNWYYISETISGVSNGDEAVERYADAIVRDFNGKVRIIQGVEELIDDEYAVAFRTREGDFHFCKRDDSGNWRHKRGGTPTLHRITKERLFSEQWPGGYDSRIVLFAVKK